MQNAFRYVYLLLQQIPLRLLAVKFRFPQLHLYGKTTFSPHRLRNLEIQIALKINMLLFAGEAIK